MDFDNKMAVDNSIQFFDERAGGSEDNLCLRISELFYRQIAPLPVVGWWQMLGLYYCQNGTVVRRELLRDLLWNRPIEYNLYPEERDHRWYILNIKRVIRDLVSLRKVRVFDTTVGVPIPPNEFRFRGVRDTDCFLPVKGYWPRIKCRTLNHDLIVSSVLLSLETFFNASLWSRKDWRDTYGLTGGLKGAWPDGVVQIGNNIFGVEVETSVNIPKLYEKINSYPLDSNALVFLDVQRESSLVSALRRVHQSTFFMVTQLWLLKTCEEKIPLSTCFGNWCYLTPNGFEREDGALLKGKVICYDWWQRMDTEQFKSTVSK